MRCIITGVCSLSGFTDGERGLIEQHFSVDDPEYHRKLRINPQGRFYLSPQYRFYTWKEELLVPRGGVRWLAKTFPTIKFIDNSVVAPVSLPTAREIVFREEQVGIVDEMLCAKQGIGLFPTGFGKTILALGIMRALNQRTLILTPTSPVKEQFIDDIKTYFGIDAKKETSDIFVATPRFVVSRGEAGRFDGGRYGLVIYDECDGAVVDGAQKVWQYLPARYRYGFTGTFDRTDGKGPAINFFFGDVLSERTKTMATPTVHIHKYTGGGVVDRYHLMTQDLARDSERNDFIMSLPERGKKTLILTKRVEHYQLLANIAPTWATVHTISATDSARKELLAKLRSGTEKYDIIIGTYNLLGRGLDIPSLDVLILAGDLKSRVLQRQAAGRVLRLLEGKEPVIHDIVDSKNPILNIQARERRKVYQSLNWPIKLCQTKEGTQRLFPQNVLEIL